MTQPPDDAALVARLRDVFSDAINEHGPSGYGRDTCCQNRIGALLIEVERTVLTEAATALEAKDRRIAELEAALRRSGVALDDWLHTYADDLCDPAVVEASRQRIGQCGTLAYIAEVQQQNRAALEPSDKGVG